MVAVFACMHTASAAVFSLVSDERYVRAISIVQRGSETAGADFNIPAPDGQPWTHTVPSSGVIGLSRGDGLATQTSTFSPIMMSGSGRVDAGSAREFTTDFAYGGGFSEYNLIFTLNEPTLLRMTGFLNASGGSSRAIIREYPQGASYVLQDFTGPGSRDLSRDFSLPAGQFAITVGGATQYAAQSPTYLSLFTEYEFTLTIIPAPSTAALAIGAIAGALVRRRR